MPFVFPDICPQCFWAIREEGGRCTPLQWGFIRLHRVWNGLNICIRKAFDIEGRGQTD